MPALIVTSNGIMMKRIVSLKQAAEYKHCTIRELKRNYPFDFIDCGSKGIGIDTQDLDTWIDLQKNGNQSNNAEAALTEF